MKRNTRRRSLHTSDGMNPAPESANMNLPHNAADQDLFPVKTGKSSCPVTLTSPSATAPLAEIKDPQLRETECMKRGKNSTFRKNCYSNFIFKSVLDGAGIPRRICSMI